jgi:hypothetical protein
MKTLMALGLLSALPSLALAEGLVCGNLIIERGSSREEVRSQCGDPAQIDSKRAWTGNSGVIGRNPSIVAGSATEIEIEIWIYNFGPNKLMEKIRFEDGIVADIQSMGYGYNE